MAEYDEIRAALSHIGADDRDMWIRMGQPSKTKWVKTVSTCGMNGLKQAAITTPATQKRPGNRSKLDISVSVHCFIMPDRTAGGLKNPMFRFLMPKKLGGRRNPKQNGLKQSGCGKKATNV